MIRALLLTSTGTPAGHPYDRTGPLMREIVEREAATVTEIDLARLESDGALAGFEVVVLHGHYGQRPRELVERLERFVHEGGGLVVVHIASSSFEGDARFRRLVGRVWEYFYLGEPFTSSHPLAGPFDIERTAQSHPITSDMQMFRLERDERYERLLVAPDAEIVDVATATINGRTEPVAWVLTPSRGRVFHVTPGHDASTYTNHNFERLVRRGINWAASGETRLSMTDKDDDAQLRSIVRHLEDAWNVGDARAWVRDYHPDCLLINMLGSPLIGIEENEQRHANVFSGIFAGSRIGMTVDRIGTLAAADVAVVDTTLRLTGYKALPPNIVPTDAAGRVLVMIMRHILERGEAGWRIRYSQNQAVPPPPQAGSLLSI